MKYLVNLKGREVITVRFEATIEIEADDEESAIQIAEDQSFEGTPKWTEDTDLRDESGIVIIEAEVERAIEEGD